MLAEIKVRGALADAGYGALPLGDRGALYGALTLVMRDDPERFGDLVDELRAVLQSADDADEQDELERLREKFKTIKGCPFCHSKPDIQSALASESEAIVVCNNHDGSAVWKGGSTIDRAITSWNSDGWIGPDITRTFFAI